MNQVLHHEDVPRSQVYSSVAVLLQYMLPLSPPSFRLFRHFFLFKNKRFFFKKKKAKTRAHSRCPAWNQPQVYMGLSSRTVQTLPVPFLLPPEGPFR